MVTLGVRTRPEPSTCRHMASAQGTARHPQTQALEGGACPQAPAMYRSGLGETRARSPPEAWCQAWAQDPRPYCMVGFVPGPALANPHPPGLCWGKSSAHSRAAAGWSRTGLGLAPLATVLPRSGSTGRESADSGAALGQRGCPGAGDRTGRNRWGHTVTGHREPQGRVWCWFLGALGEGLPRWGTLSAISSAHRTSSRSNSLECCRLFHKRYIRKSK